MSTLNEEILKRRTFAIISHPDAGKTTLTEKLLLFGGAIHVAGAVKSNKIKKTATSDWMEIEKQRGISVATSVMGFNYGDYKINIAEMQVGRQTEGGEAIMVLKVDQEITEEVVSKLEDDNDIDFVKPVKL